MLSASIEEFWQELIADIKSNKLILPGLPEVTLRVRKLLDAKGGATASKIATAISADAVLSTRLLRVVNSPLYRGANPIEDIRGAVTRLGNANVRNIVTSLAMEQIYQDRVASPEKKRLLAHNREHSMIVAALSWFIANRYTRLNAEEAMLVGLIHDIGKLPIIEYAELAPELADKAVFQRLLEVLHPRVGALMLRSWKFSPELVAAVAEHENFNHNPDTPASYTDVVIVANLLSHIGSDHPCTRLDWSTVPAFNRLKLRPEESIDAMKNARGQINEVKQLLAA
ncbi:MAG: HDOD domain-containing protein [Chromatiales bacterium]|jgi:putative nucleotidyltransferase with HDIG domain|nr:HDOD domain-containing protein [Chromatiales bacterium]